MADKPIIYAHRGVWVSAEEQNSTKSILRASQLGFGVETDFRSKSGKLVISHDPQIQSEAQEIDCYEFSGLPVALNVKEDGLAKHYSEFLKKYPNENSFIFDGSIPEMLKIREAGLPHALRLSEYERELPWETSFIWVDAFHGEWWIDSELIENLLKNQMPVFVSPEIHGRDRREAWNYFRKLKQLNFGTFGVCTDFPVELKECFDE